MSRPSSVGRMVKALSDEVIIKRIQGLRHKYAKRLEGLWAESIPQVNQIHVEKGSHRQRAAG